MPGAIIAAVTPIVPFVLGLVALALGSAVLRSFGPRFRVGRLIGGTPVVTVAEAAALAGRAPRYVGVRGRIDAEDEFEDENHRPLVFRRTRLEWRDAREWMPAEDRREAVRFELREGHDGIAIDPDALDDGLVVVSREAVGTAADVASDRLPAGLSPTTPVRMRIEQVSSVEHALALGVPVQGPDGTPVLTAGLGRPLVLTTLEPGEAMRVIAQGRTRRPVIAAISLAAGLVLVSVALAWALLDALL